MALIKCKECGCEVSADAKSCPKCGARLKKSGCLPILGYGFLGLIALAVIGDLVGGPNKATQPADNGQRTRETEDYATKTLGEQTIRSMLKDPASGVFTDSEGRIKAGMHVACGYVNAKNSFGAMAGTSPWLVIVETKAAMIETPENAGKFVPLWNKYCSSSEDGKQPQRAAPDTFRGIRWNSTLPSVHTLRKTVLKGCVVITEQKNVIDTPPCSHMHLDTDDMDLFTQRQHVSPIFDVPVSEQLLEWSYRKFWSGEIFIYDYREADLAKLRAALIAHYGNPTFVNEQQHITK
jgi:zinc-ribbon domain